MSPEEKAKADEIYKAIIGKERNTLVKRYGKDAEKVAKGRAIKQAQKLAEKKMESSKDRLKEMVKSALMGTNEELKGGQKKLDANKNNKIDAEDFKLLRKGKVNEMLASIIGQAKTYAEEKYPQLTDQDIKDFINMHGQDIMDGSDLEAEFDNYVYQNFDLEEDLDLGHTDNEPHMLKKDLYHIGKYAMDLYQMVDQFEGMGEVDFPHWWQSKIIKAKEMMSSAKHYLDFETREPEIDAMVGAIDMSGALDNVGVDEGIFDRFKKKPAAPAKGYTMTPQEIKNLLQDGDPADILLNAFLHSKYNDNPGAPEELEREIAKNIEKYREVNKEMHDGDHEEFELTYQYYLDDIEKRYGKVSEDVKAEAREKYKAEVKEGLPKSLAQRIAKKLKEDVVKGSNIRKETNENEDILGDIISDMLKYKTKEEVLAYLKQKISSLDESYKALVKRVKEDVVKGSNIRKDSKGKWRVLSGKTGKMWPQTYDSKADAEDALQAYHATKG